jgi:hypothetical protein
LNGQGGFKGDSAGFGLMIHSTQQCAASFHFRVRARDGAFASMLGPPYGVVGPYGGLSCAPMPLSLSFVLVVVDPNLVVPLLFLGTVGFHVTL